MNQLNTFILTIGLAVYFVLHSAQHHVLGPEWLRFYGKDLLFVPLLLAAVYHSTLLLGIQPRHLLRHTLAATLYSAIVFEYVWPRLSPNAHGDPADVVCYAVGGCCYAFGMILRRRIEKKEQILPSSQVV
jgi:hypothetical protein